VRGRLAAVLGLALLLARPGAGMAEAVDHYVLALSWSPTFCESADPERERLQGERRVGLGPPELERLSGDRVEIPAAARGRGVRELAERRADA